MSGFYSLIGSQKSLKKIFSEEALVVNEWENWNSN